MSTSIYVTLNLSKGPASSDFVPSAVVCHACFCLFLSNLKQRTAESLARNIHLIKQQREKMAYNQSMSYFVRHSSQDTPCSCALN